MQIELNRLEIGKLVAKIPIIQGGMAIRISMWQLAAAVAQEGGIGLIAASGIKAEELVQEVRKARENTDGIIGINIMHAANAADFKANIEAAIENGIDLVVMGAGISRDIFRIVEGRVPVVIIASSVRVAQFAEKNGASAVILEGKEAGGHLGTEFSTWELLPELVASVQIPVIAAGGIRNGADIRRALNLGAKGVQIGSLFAVSEESKAHVRWKETCLRARPEDIVLVDSPVGLKGRAIRNTFTDRLFAGQVVRVENCQKKCLRHCNGNFCISTRLIMAQEGDIERGLIFLGEPPVSGSSRIRSVKEIVSQLSWEYERAYEG